MDLYDILEIKPNASEVEIKKAYFKLVKIYHPDKNSSPDAAIKFQKIQSAYDILSNKESRQEYQKMNQKEKTSFMDILEKIIGDKINLDEFKKYSFNINKPDFEYIQKNFMNFFRAINVAELLDLFKKGIVPKKKLDTMYNCSESDNDFFDDTCAEFFYSLPISLQKPNHLDINIEMKIKLSDLVNNNKKKIKIKRNIDGIMDTSTFVFSLDKPYIVFIGGGDSNRQFNGNLIIKLELENNLLWTQNLILIEQSMNLYEMIYGLDIKLDLGDGKNIQLNNWVPSRDGFLIEISNNKLNNIESNVLPKHNLAIKLFLNYEHSPEKEQLLAQYFS
jgi:curved DNA-binding protein CbpA